MPIKYSIYEMFSNYVLSCLSDGHHGRKGFCNFLLVSWTFFQKIQRIIPHFFVITVSKPKPVSVSNELNDVSIILFVLSLFCKTSFLFIYSSIYLFIYLFIYVTCLYSLHPRTCLTLKLISEAIFRTPRPFFGLRGSQGKF